MKVCTPRFVWPLIFMCQIFFSTGCVISTKSPEQKVRVTALTDFAGTYRNLVDDPYFHFSPLLNVLWPKHPALSPDGLRATAVDRVRIRIEGKSATLTFLIKDRVWGEVRYLEGQDFKLSDSAVPIETRSGAGATMGGGGDGMENTLPHPPVAGAIIARTKLFLNKDRDLVIRTDKTTAMMVLFVAPLVLSDSEDLTYRRVSE